MSASCGGLSGRRRLCERCERPLLACWCACVHRVDNRSALLILQDPQEAVQAKGTAALLARCLSRVELRVGDRFDPPRSVEGLVLLYPRTPDNASLRSLPQRGASTGTSAVPTTLVVLDGTWRRSRRLLALNPWLQTLTRFALEAPPPSRYIIRRAQADSQRSTLEACALALAAIDDDEVRYAPLWQAMDDFVALQRRLASSPAATPLAPRAE